jgi:hypothetical protein
MSNKELQQLKTAITSLPEDLNVHTDEDTLPETVNLRIQQRKTQIIAGIKSIKPTYLDLIDPYLSGSKNFLIQKASDTLDKYTIKRNPDFGKWEEDRAQLLDILDHVEKKHKKKPLISELAKGQLLFPLIVGLILLIFGAIFNEKVAATWKKIFTPLTTEKPAQPAKSIKEHLVCVLSGKALINGQAEPQISIYYRKEKLVTDSAGNFKLSLPLNEKVAETLLFSFQHRDTSIVFHPDSGNKKISLNWAFARKVPTKPNDSISVPAQKKLVQQPRAQIPKADPLPKSTVKPSFEFVTEGTKGIQFYLDYDIYKTSSRSIYIEINLYNSRKQELSDQDPEVGWHADNGKIWLTATIEKPGPHLQESWFTDDGLFVQASKISKSADGEYFYRVLVGQSKGDHYTQLYRSDYIPLNLSGLK